MEPDIDYRNILDILPCYLSIQDPELRIIYANRAVIHDFGAAIGEYCHEVYKKSPLKCSSCPAQKTFQDKNTHFSEETVRIRNGAKCQIAVYTAPVVDNAGSVTGVIEMAANLSKVKIAQKELKILGSSISILSHGIKNILEGLQGGAYVVDEGIKENSIHLAQKGWNIVKKNIADIVDVSQNILYSSKGRPLRYERVSPDEIVMDCYNTFKEKASFMNIDLRLEATSDLPSVNLDPLGIRRMLNNFIWNAMEACIKDSTKDSHFVAVRTGYYDNDHFVIEVEDNGVGIDDKTKKNIFRQFYSTKGCGGTGLGLSVADAIINKHGGVREVDSTPGMGSTFRVIFKIQ